MKRVPNVTLCFKMSFSNFKFNQKTTDIFRPNKSGLKLKFEIPRFSGDKIELKQTFSILFGHIISDLKSEFRDLKISDLKFPT